MNLSKEDAREFMADRAHEVGFTPERLEAFIREHVQYLDDVYDEYADERSSTWVWEDFWKVAAIAYDLPKALKRSRSMFTSEDPIEDSCRGCW